MKNEGINGQEDIPSSKLKKNKLLIGCFLTIVILSALIIVGREIFILIDINYAKGNPTNLPASFSWSLRDHDYRMVKALTDPKLWPELENWMDEHEQVKCPLLPILTLGDEGQGGGIATKVTENGEIFWIGHQYISIVCPDPAHYYCLEVTDIIVKQKGDQWIVTEVGSIEEYWSEYGCD